MFLSIYDNGHQLRGNFCISRKPIRDWKILSNISSIIERVELICLIVFQSFGTVVVVSAPGARVAQIYPNDLSRSHLSNHSQLTNADSQAYYIIGFESNGSKKRLPSLCSSPRSNARLLRNIWINLDTRSQTSRFVSRSKSLE